MIDFPADPTVGQTFSAGGKTWQWDGVAWSAIAPPLSIDVQEFTTPGTSTWVKPAGASFVRLIMSGGGEGGGSGDRNATTEIRNGGLGGRAAMIVDVTFRASDLSETASVFVGAGGPGGPAVDEDDTEGSFYGSPGQSSRFNDDLLVGGEILADGGGGSLNHFVDDYATNLFYGYKPYYLPSYYVSTTQTRFWQNGTGGSAAAVNADETPDVVSGSNGAPVETRILDDRLAFGGSEGNGTTPNGGNGTSGVWSDIIFGAGGGSGAYRTGMPGGNGGNGAPGAGGGGGAASDNGYASGAGGNGGNGWVKVIAW
jgi:hypothetical protein